MLAAALVFFASAAVVRQWSALRVAPGTMRLAPGRIAISAAVVLGTYAVLVETWRRVVVAWASSIAFVPAARIWFVSNLYRYVPGKVWQIGAMGVMAKSAGVAPVAASGSAILVNLVSIVAGFAVVVLTGARAIALPAAGSIGVGLAAVLIVATPAVLPQVRRLAFAVTGRALAIPDLPARAIWIAAAGSMVAWLLYGVAFQQLTAGILGAAPGSTSSYIAVYTASYLIGYLALFAPGGIGVREAALFTAMTNLHMAAAGQAIVLAVTSRLWLTVLEVVPGLVFLMAGAVRRSHPPIGDRGA